MEQGEMVHQVQIVRLVLAEAQFDVFVTADKRLRYQQNLKARKLAVVVIPSNQVPIVAALLPTIESVLLSVQFGTLVEIPLPPTEGI